MLNLFNDFNSIYEVSIDSHKSYFVVSYGTTNGVTHHVENFTSYEDAKSSAFHYLSTGRVKRFS